ncbi:hypothetical protein IJG78_02690 [Candidatus Saccharibacteria bacterium]|nr:hypothetical protein [Candidatus Saccharibacteria bacterium]
MDYNSYDGAEDKQQRTRIIIITTAIAIIVLGIAAWAIIAIVGSRAPEVAETTPTVAVDDATSREKTKEEQPAPVTEGVTKTTAPAATNTKAQETVPETGPEELLPGALVAGLGTTYVASRKLAKAHAK